ncbi:MAG: class I SAM-dependent methyltransferase [Proteobacteria bacterium]|jgi:SAM-dependent methyltransferase|nr:class I SAM-dependent methyltransferase [Pseudomonadota bacterium]
MSYILKTGNDGKRRLDVVNYLYNQESSIFIKKANIDRSSTILDAGCGTGIMTIKLANLVKNGGRVIAIDQSIEQIRIAKQNIMKHGIKNVEFIVDDILNLKKYNLKLDVIYSRLILTHQKDPNLLLKTYTLSLKHSGIILCEEPITSSSIYIPSSKAFDNHLDLYLKISRLNKLDFDLGNKLSTLFQNNNLSIVTQRRVQNTFTNKKAKSIALLRTLECADIYLQQNLIEEKSLESLIQELKSISNSPMGAISGVEMVQVIGCKS